MLNLGLSVGRFIARNPWRVIILAVFLEGMVFGFGLLRFELVTDYRPQYPFTSRALDDAKTVERLFPYAPFDYQRTRPEFTLSIIFKPLFEGITIRDTRFTNDVSNSNFYFQCWFGTSDISNIQYLAHSEVKYPFFERSDGLYYYGDQIAHPRVNDTGYLTAGAAFKWTTVLVNNYGRSLISCLDNEISSLKHYYSFNSHQYFHIAFSHSQSLEQEMRKDTLSDDGLYYMCYVMVMVASCVAMSSACSSVVAQRMTLVLAAVLSEALSILGTLGIYSVSGLKFTEVLRMAPLFSFGMSLFAVHVLLDSLAECPSNGMDTVEQRIGKAVSESSAVLHTILMGAVVFGISAAATTLSEYRKFCIFSSILLALNFINLMTLLTACTSMNERRIELNWHFLKCCMPVRNPTALTTESGEMNNLPERLMKRYLPVILNRVVGQAVIVCSSVALFAVCIYGSAVYKVGWDPDSVVSKNSYLYKYNQWNKDIAYPKPVSFVIYETVDYSDGQVQNDIERLLGKAQQSDYIFNGRQMSWLHRFRSKFNFTNNYEFVSKLKRYTQNTWYNNVNIDSYENNITSSRFFVFPKLLTDEKDRCAMMKEMRDLADESPLPVFAFASDFIHYEECRVFLIELFRFFGVLLLFLMLSWIVCFWYPFMLPFIIIGVAVAFTCVFGCMSFWSLGLNSITLSCLSFAMCFLVMFIYHVASKYPQRQGNRLERAKDCVKSGVPIIKGSVAYIIGCVILAAGTSFMYRTAFKMLLLTVIFGVGCAVFVLPAVLSLIGPPTNSSKVEDAEIVANQMKVQY